VPLRAVPSVLQAVLLEIAWRPAACTRLCITSIPTRWVSACN
jgi:hypothetical protein